MSSPAHALHSRALSLGFGQRCVLDEASFAVPARGIVGVMGPGGVGKSTLLRTLSRRAQALPTFWLDGDVLLADGRSLFHDLSMPEARRTVPLLFQKAALYTATVLDNAIDAVRDGTQSMGTIEKRVLAHQVLEPLDLWREYEPVLDEPVLSLSIGAQRVLSLARMMSTDPICLLVDEPFRDIDETSAGVIRDLLLHAARFGAVVLAEHNQRIVRALCDEVCLLAGGTVVESGPATAFFRAPMTELGAEFVRSGNCWPSEGTRETPPPMPLPAAPKAFHWVMPQRLGGTQWPGLLGCEEEDLAALRGLGCDVLVTLTIEPFPLDALARHDIDSIHFPIEDMDVPSVASTVELCRRLSELHEQGKVIVLHCRAGLGRTGTMLACYLVYQGRSAVSAVDEVRSINPYYIQSIVQLQFIGELERYLRGGN